ncbi:MAG TPA: hypothetical protein V6D26_09090 [Stenomitos sp.]
MLFRGKAITLHGQTWAIANARNPVEPIQISDDFRLGITSLNNAVATRTKVRALPQKDSR